MESRWKPDPNPQGSFKPQRDLKQGNFGAPASLPGWLEGALSAGDGADWYISIHGGEASFFLTPGSSKMGSKLYACLDWIVLGNRVLPVPKRHYKSSILFLGDQFADHLGLERCEWWRVLAALREDLGSVLSIYDSSKPSVIPVPGIRCPLLASAGTACIRWTDLKA